MLVGHAGRILQSRLGIYVVSLAAAWCLINAALYFGFIGFAEDLPIPARLTLGAFLLWIPLTEASLFGLAISSLKSMRRVGRSSTKTLAGILISVAIPVTAVLVLVVMTEWVLRAHGQSFPKPSVVRALLTNLGSVAPLMRFRELAGFAWALGVGVLVAGGSYCVTPVLSWAEIRKFLILGGINCFILGALIRAVPPQLTVRERNRIDGLVKADFLPTSTLVWAMLLPGHMVLPVHEALAPRNGTPASGAGGNHPNIILISVESLRRGEESRISDQGYVMPALHRLANEGVHFTRAYAPSNESAYSLSAILTSQHMLKTSARDNFRNPATPYVRIYDLLHETYATGFFSADTEEWQNMKAVSQSPKLDRFFDASHATVGVLKVPDADTGFRNAVQRGELPNGNLDDEYPVRAFEEWVDHLAPSAGQSASATRFFAVIKFESSHFPYEQGFDVPVRFSPANLSPAELGSLSFLSYPRELAPRLQRRYWNSLSYDDSLIQRILEYLRSRKALEDTVVIVFGDHGELFYENGAVTHADRLWEQTLNTAFVVWGAKKWAPSEYKEPVSLLDIAPIVLDLAGVAPYGGFQGRVPARLRSRAATVEAEPRPIFSVSQNIRFEESVLVGPWRYTVQSDDLYETLHDVLRDPFETHDEMRSHAEVAACLYATLVEFRQNQLGYYNRPDLVRSYFPPRHRLADVPACAVLRVGSAQGSP